MVQQRLPYIVDLNNLEIFPADEYKKEESGHFFINAADEDIHKLEKLFHEISEADWKTYARAHIPFVEYHQDQQNEEYDRKLKEIYLCLYKLGDTDTREFIESNGLIKK